MRNYIARVLVEHQLTPKPEDYSSFSELIILGKFELPKNVEFSQLLFDESELTIGIINQLLALMTKKINDEYTNPNGEKVHLFVKKISKIEDVGLDFSIDSDIYELDERLYTFNKPMTFKDFKKIYYSGLFSE
ncbi:hypothetical protein [Streptococcus dysgalactiae]|uniref:hypothetical protein n=1 Tax=Streptococcus dysgalactiae TaxID=1334 RepID=UPI0010E45374|nr:hypothetical protein [Streptococcus dysgalactiae]VTT07915.1 Uncharacterised protein [Streptococcus dysgalactiae subsp. equisimilis]